MEEEGTVTWMLKTLRQTFEGRISGTQKRVTVLTLEHIFIYEENFLRRQI